MRSLALFALLLPLAASGQVALDPLPVIYLPGGAGAEECYAQWSTVAAVRAHSAPTSQSRVVRTIDAQRRVDANDYSESLTAVLRSGLTRAVQPVSFEAASAGSGETRTVRLGAGDEVEVLGNAGEGFVYFTSGTSVLVGFIPGYYGGGEVEVVRRPVVEIWVRLIEHGGDRPAAWLNTAQAGLIEREAYCEP